MYICIIKTNNMKDLTITATTTSSYSELMAIKQILLGFTSAPLVKEFFASGYTNLGNIKIEHVDYQFKRLNQAKIESRKK